MGRARPWKLDPHGIAKAAIRKGVRGTMKWSPAAPMGGERGERKVAATLGTNIIAGIVRKSFIPLLCCPPRGDLGAVV